MSNLVQTEQVSKAYAAVHALRPCTLAVGAGEVFGLLGPNGAGKTTLLRLLMGFLRPTTGQATIAGLDCTTESVAVHRLTSYLPGETRLSRTLRGREVLDFFCRLRPGSDLQRALQIAERLELDLSRTVSLMSTGMRQKTALAAVLSFNTRLVILDEPTANLDPTARAEVLKLVREAQAAGRTVIFSSHVLSEVEDVCDRVAVLRDGELVHEQQLAELRRQHRIALWLRGDLPPLPPEQAAGVTIARRGDGAVQLDTPHDLAPLLSWLATLQLQKIRIEPVRLQAVYERFHSPQAA